MPPAVKRSGERGYVLIVFVLFAALLLVGLSSIIPKAIFEGQREKEDELVFRGLQYQRATQLFFRKFGRYPVSVDELLKTNNFRFLRRKYRDPMTKDGDWRVIHVGPNGAFMDSLNAVTAPAPAASGITGATPIGGTNPTSTATGQGSSPQTSQFGVGSPFTTGQTQGQGQAPTMGLTPQPGTSSGQPPPFFDPALSPSANPGANPQRQPQSSTLGQQPGAASPFGQTTPGATGTGNVVFGGGAIGGFASKSQATSIRTFNGYTEYDQWEFLFDFRKDPIAAAKLGGAQTQPQGTGLPNQPGSPQNQPGFQNPGGPSNFPGFPGPGGSVNQPGLAPANPGGGLPRSPFSPTPGAFPPPRTR